MSAAHHTACGGRPWKLSRCRIPSHTPRRHGGVSASNIPGDESASQWPAKKSLRCRLMSSVRIISWTYGRPWWCRTPSRPSQLPFPSFPALIFWASTSSSCSSCSRNLMLPILAQWGPSSASSVRNVPQNYRSWGRTCVSHMKTRWRGVTDKAEEGPDRLAVVNEDCRRCRIRVFRHGRLLLLSRSSVGGNRDRASAAHLPCPGDKSIRKWYRKSSWTQRTCLELDLFVSIKRRRLLWFVSTKTSCLQPSR